MLVPFLYPIRVFSSPAHETQWLEILNAQRGYQLPSSPCYVQWDHPAQNVSYWPERRNRRFSHAFAPYEGSQLGDFPAPGSDPNMGPYFRVVLM
jgi:hypothetical protein